MLVQVFGEIYQCFSDLTLLLNYILVCTDHLKFGLLLLHHFYIREVGSFKNVSIHYTWTLSYCVFGSAYVCVRVCVCACVLEWRDGMGMNDRSQSAHTSRVHSQQQAVT